MAHVVLILVLLTLCYGVSSRPKPAFECPDQYAESIWFNRAVKICPENHQTYHCLMVTNITSTDRYREFCQKPQRIPKGEYVVYDTNTKTIKHMACPSGRFQPVERTSNSSMAYQCEKEMTPCNLQGQRPCDDGRPYEDRTCRCKFEEGYILEAFAYGNDDKITCVHPLIITLSCSQLNMCSENQEVDRYYKCEKKCPDGYYRPDGGGCYKRPTNMSSTQSPPSSTTFMVTSTTKVNVMTVDEGGSNGAIVIAISVILLIVLLLLIIGGIYCCKHTEVQKCIANLFHNQGTDNTDRTGDISSKPSIICFNFTNYDQEIYVKKVDNLAVGSNAKISDGKISKKKEKKKKKDKQEDAEETIALMEGSKEAEVIHVPNTVDDHEDPSLEQDNSDNKGQDSDGCVDRDLPDEDSTIPKEIATNKNFNPDSKVAENSPLPDDDSEVCKDIENTKENDAVEKEESSPDCNEYMKDMKLAAKKKGWEVEDVPKDGSCFYHCVRKLYVSKNGWDVSTLRKKLRKYLESNAKLYKEFVTETWENLLSGIENNKWADHVEISAMAEMLKVPIIIHKLNSTGDQLEVKEEIKPKNCHVEPLNIGHILVNKEGFHFVALVPMRLTES